IGPAPVRPGQERPAYLDLAFRFVVAVESRGPDDAAVLAVDGDQGAPRFHGFAKEDLENLFLVSVIARMLLPNKRISGNRVQVVEILRAKRSEFEEVAFQIRLEVKWHS